MNHNPMFPQGKKDRFKNTTINYFLMDQAVLYYTNLGYEYIDAPWFCKPETSNITRPVEAMACHVELFKKDLVGSGEQSLLDIRHHFVSGEKLLCITPCFRDEMVLSDAKRQYFLKLELMKVLHSEEEGYVELLEDAYRFFTRFKVMSCRNNCRVTKTDVGEDIYLGNYEIGSYGVRKYGDFIWAYGTGLAEPRFSIALNNDPERK